jgi:parvulin-like peptidyl-prolyl isomerase
MSASLNQALHRLILDQAIATVEYTEVERQHFLQQNDVQISQLRLRQEGATPEQLEQWLDRELKIRLFQQRKWGKMLHTYFLKRKHDLDRVSYSIIYLRDVSLAQELYFRIVEAEQSFAEVARCYSEGKEAQAGGAVQPIELGNLPAKLAHMFYGARPGQLWTPTILNGWIVIVQLNGHFPVQLDLAMQRMLLNEQLENWIQAQLRQRFP